MCVWNSWDAYAFSYKISSMIMLKNYYYINDIICYNYYKFVVLVLDPSMCLIYQF